MDQQVKVKKPRLAFRIASHLPQPLRLIYYVLLFGTLVYIAYLLLDAIRSVVCFLFSRPAFYSIIVCILVFFALRYFDVELPWVDEIIVWIEDKVEFIKTYLKNILNQYI